MTILNIELLGGKNCRVRNNYSSSVLLTSAPVEYQGDGKEFSSTDLLAAAIGTCIGSSLEEILNRNNIELRNVGILVRKELSTKPKNISALNIEIEIHQNVKDIVKKKILRVAETCLVLRSLKFTPQIDIISID